MILSILLHFMSASLLIATSLACEKRIQLSFVFDTSGSMTDDWQQVKSSAIEIVQSYAAEKHTTDFIIVPFNDPDVGPVFQTTNIDEFLDMLDKIEPSGGGDCPEKALSGIQLALERGSSNSLIYVFTDASAKDYNKIDIIKKLMRMKQSQIIFILTGHCHSVTDRGHTVFREIATLSSGMIYLIPRSDVTNFMRIVRDSIKKDRINILQEDSYGSGSKSYNFSIDASMKQFSLHVTVPYLNVNVTTNILDPHGNIVGEKDGLIKILRESSSAFAALLKNPTPGMWSLTVSTSSNQHSVRINGLSKVDFYPRFAYRNDIPYNEASNRPISGLPNYIYVKIEGNYSINHLVVLSNNGSIIADTTVTLQTGSTEYMGNEAISFSSRNMSSYFLKIEGSDNTGDRYQRYSTTAYIPQDIEATISCPYTVKISNGSVVYLECVFSSPIRMNLKTFHLETSLRDNNENDQLMNLSFALKDSSENNNCLPKSDQSRTFVFHLETNQLYWSTQLQDKNSTQFKQVESDFCSLYEHGLLSAYNDTGECNVTQLTVAKKSVTATIELVSRAENVRGALVEEAFQIGCKGNLNIVGCFLLKKKTDDRIPLDSKAARQSTTFPSHFYASLAIDGDCSSQNKFTSPRHSKTAYERKPIWWIDMKKNYFVEKISVRVKTHDCNRRYLRKISFMVSDVEPNFYQREISIECSHIDAPIVTNNLDLPCGRTGRFFSILYDGISIMEICNLKLYGHPLN